jgi:hypothetical protein
VFHSKDRKSVIAQLKKCLNNPNKVHTWEIRKVKKDGSMIWFRENANATLIGNRKTCIKILCEDITEMKNAEFLLNTENKVLEMITQNSSLSRTLDYLCREIEIQTPGMLCSFLLVDEKGEHLRHGAAPSLPKEYIKAIDGLQIGPSIDSCGTAAYMKKPVIVSDIETDPLWADYKHLALKHDLKACWSTPIISTGKNVLGTFAMFYDHTNSPNSREKKDHRNGDEPGPDCNRADENAGTRKEFR